MTWRLLIGQTKSKQCRTIGSAAQRVEFGLPITDEDGQPRNDTEPLAVFTTRPDTGFGMTFAVLSPEHPRVDELTTDEEQRIGARIL